MRALPAGSVWTEPAKQPHFVWAKGLRFETLEAAQAYLDRWDARWADTRIHGTTKRQVAAMFAATAMPANAHSLAAHQALARRSRWPQMKDLAR
jgi:hypothetical protein